MVGKRQCSLSFWLHAPIQLTCCLYMKELQRNEAADSTPVGGITLLPPPHLLPRQQMKEIKAEQTAAPPLPQRFISFRIRPGFFFSPINFQTRKKNKENI